MLASPTVRKKGRRVAVAFAAGSGRRRCWHSSNLVHLQHRHHVDDERIGYGPNRDEDSPLPFPRTVKTRLTAKVQMAMRPTNFQIPGDGINPCGLPPL